jgi:AcrR family transcriptional regulator
VNWASSSFMAAVAERAGSSKETLYAWFGSKQGLLTALIRREAEAANQAVAAALDSEKAAADPAGTLTAFATNLLRQLLGERSVAINRAAIADLGGGRAAGREPAASWRPCCWPRAATATDRSSRPTWPAWPTRAGCA